jgi:uncharacterized protein YndB with AHSA1/START domain
MAHVNRCDSAKGRCNRVMSRTDAASGFVAAPPERVYAAFVDPDSLMAWLPPAGMTAKFERFDPGPGGSYRMVLTYSDASNAPGKTTINSDIVDVRFVDVVANVRVVQEVDFVSDDPSFAGTMTMTWKVTVHSVSSTARDESSTEVVVQIDATPARRV